MTHYCYIYNAKEQSKPNSKAKSKIIPSPSYAFVNLRDPLFARLFLKISSGSLSRERSGKALRIIPANYQGQDELDRYLGGGKE